MNGDHVWRSLEDDRDVSEAYANRYPDAVYDAADPDWYDILYIDEETGEEIDVDDIDYIDSDVVDEPDLGLDEYDWDEEDMYDDDGYYEVEIGIDYGSDT